MTSVDGATSISDVLGKLPASTTPTKTDNSQLGNQDFLNLLVAQLKYQDPSSPMDSSQLMAQTAQFTMVESMQQMAKESSALLAAQQMSSASGLIGRSVTYPGTDNLDHTGVVTAARISTDGVVLRIGDTDVPLTSVKEVAAATTPATGTTTAG